MAQILEFLVAHCSFLWSSARYRIESSELARSFGDAWLVVASDVMRLRFVRDRGQLFLDFQEGNPGPKSEWYSIDLIWRLVTGTRQASAELGAEYAAFLQASLTEIESRFTDDNLAETKRRLHDLKRIRAKEMFG